MWKDASDPKTARALYGLVVINSFVIAQGIYSFRLKLKTKLAGLREVLFYIMSLSCLVVAEVYFLSSLWTGNKCFQLFIQDYPSYAYLMTAYTYLVISIRNVNTNTQVDKNLEEYRREITNRKRYTGAIYVLVAVITILFLL